MSGKARLLFAVLAGVFLLVVVCWLVSGRGIFTHHLKVTSVSVANPLFGDIETEQQFVPGPILGYYVGFDLVLLSAVTCGVIALVTWVLQRRRLRRKES